MTQSEIRTLFHKAYGDSKNFMTPTVIRYGKKGNYVYELSKGTGFNREVIYGVTVLNTDGEKQPDLSHGGFTKQEANEHIEELKELD